MGAAVAQLLGVAIGFALSPIALVEMLLVLFSRRARVNSVVFLLAIIIPVFLVPFAGASGEQAASSSTGRPTAAAIVLLVIAAVLILLAWRNFRQRHSGEVPAVLGRIEGMGPAAVLLLSAGVTVANPKNLVILLGAGAIAGKQGLSPGQLATKLAIFTVIATSPFLAMTGYLLFGGDGAGQRLQAWKDWLIRNNQLIMAIVFAVLGVVLAVHGATSL